jgi:hypothetical protein
MIPCTHVHYWSPAPFVPFLHCVYCGRRTLGRYYRWLYEYKVSMFQPFGWMVKLRRAVRV